MKTKLTSESLKIHFEPILRSCALWEGKHLHAIIIANPKAGGFALKKYAKRNLQALLHAVKQSEQKKQLVLNLSIEVWQTEYSGHATEYTTKILELVKNDTNQTEFLIIVAGGDGTSLEVQTTLFKHAPYNRITILRLPFGTGNDGADGRTLDKTLELLTEPAQFDYQGAVRVFYEGSAKNEEITLSKRKIARYGSLADTAPWYAFNIASLGIDAFITHMTNKTKDILPGNFYKIWINISALFYACFFPQKTVKVEAYDTNGNLVKSVTSPLEFCLLGVSGYRTYGSNNLILPTEDNFCAAKKMSLLNKLKHLKDFETGNHIHCPFAVFAQADRIRIWYDQYILVQMDGEARLLHPKQFPLVMEKTEPVIKIIKKI